MIGAYGAQLIDWLEKYTFVAEQQYADKRHAREAAPVYIDENLRNGITTAAVFCTSTPRRSTRSSRRRRSSTCG